MKYHIRLKGIKEMRGTEKAIRVEVA